MSTEVSQLSPEDSLSKAVLLMTSNSYSCALVIQNHVPVGIITERDIVRVVASHFSGDQSFDIYAKDVMTPDPICVDEMASIADAWSLARQRKLRHLPVVNETGELAGILTQTDMIDAYLVINESHQALERDNEELKLLSLEDALLGVGNRRALTVDLDFSQATAKRNKQHYAVAIFDVDFFKPYNDFYGHQAGDEALLQTISAIKGKMRDSDRLYRYGGDEFLLLMPNTDAAGARISAERLQSSVEELRLVHDKSPHEIVTVSVGVSSAFESDWQTLLGRADEALYEAKKAGRNQVAVLEVA